MATHAIIERNVCLEIALFCRPLTIGVGVGVARVQVLPIFIANLKAHHNIAIFCLDALVIGFRFAVVFRGGGKHLAVVRRAAELGR